MKLRMFHVKLLFIFVTLPTIVFSQHVSSTTINDAPFPVMPAKKTFIIEALEKLPEYKLLSETEKNWFYWTNLSRQKPAYFWDSIITPILNTYPNLVSKYTESLKNELKSGLVLPMLLPSKKLALVATNHANSLAKKNSPPSHNSPSGQSFQQRMVEGGINRCAAENISFGPSNEVFSLVLLYIDEKLPALGHRKTLMSKDYREMGLGIAIYPKGMTMVVQDFACSELL